MGFILLMDRIKCWLNTPLQVLTNSHSLHSLIIRQRNDAPRILEFLFRNRGYLRKLTVKNCSLGDNSTALLSNMVALYPDLESLSLESCHPLTSDGYTLIPRLKKLSELNLSDCKVDYVHVKQLETHVCIRDACRTTPLKYILLFRQEGNFLQL